MAQTGQDVPVGGTASRGRLPRGLLILIGLASATVAAFGISSVRGILAPVLLTLVLTICAHPVRTALERVGVPHGLATGSVILVVFGLLAGFTFTIIVAFARFATMLPSYTTQLHSIGATIGSWLRSVGIGGQQVHEIVAGFSPASILGFFSGILGSVFSITGALVIILTMMILMSADSVYAPTILRQLGRRSPDLVSAIGSFASSVRRYMVVTAGLGIAQGVLNGVALWIMHVPAALLWGLLSFLCSFIPNIGYFFAITPPLVFGFLVGGWPVVIAIIVVYGVINAGIQSVLQPRIVGNTVMLSQTITFFSVLFWASVVGPIGAILAIPLTLIVRTFLVDADPHAHWLRPAIGATPETKRLMRMDDAAAKQERLRKRREGGQGAATE